MTGYLFLTERIKPRLGNCEEEDKPFLVRPNNENIVPCKIQGRISDAIQVQLTENPRTNDTEWISNRKNYDPRIGFRLEQPVEPNSTFECKNVQDSSDCIKFRAFSAYEKVEATIEYSCSKKVDDDSFMEHLSCSALEKLENFELKTEISKCSRLPSCILRNNAVSTMTHLMFYNAFVIFVSKYAGHHIHFLGFLRPVPPDQVRRRLSFTTNSHGVLPWDLFGKWEICSGVRLLL